MVIKLEKIFLKIYILKGTKPIPIIWKKIQFQNSMKLIIKVQCTICEEHLPWRIKIKTKICDSCHSIMKDVYKVVI